MIRTLIVDDSRSARMFFTRALGDCSDVEVIGTAPDATIAARMVAAQRPDVMTLDLEMPGLDGLTFLEQLMASDPLPVVVVSSLTRSGSDVALRALELGAVEVLCKPSAAQAQSFPALLAAAVRAAGHARILAKPTIPALAPGMPPGRMLTPLPVADPVRLVAIGASTGGTEAIRFLIGQLPPSCPGIVIVQHLPPIYTASFAKRLDAIGSIRVREAQGGEEILPGQALVAPGGKHVIATQDGARLVLGIHNGPPEHFQRPSIDILFRSIARCCPRQAVGMVLSGMGSDGAAGLLEMRQSGCYTIAQDEATSVVFGMPRAAIACGAAERGTALERIPAAITTILQGRMARVEPSRT